MTVPHSHATPSHPPRMRKARLIDKAVANGGVVSIALFFLVVCIIFSLSTDAFLSAPNLLNIIRQSAPLLIVAAAMTFVITTGGIDLSVGSVLALSATLSAAALQAGIAWPLVVLLMLGLGALTGVVQGYFIAFERIPAFIVTLAGLSVIRGLALLITGGYSIPVEPSSPFTAIGRAWFLGMPAPALIAVVLLVALSSPSMPRPSGAMSPALAPMPRRCGAPASTRA